MSTYNPKEIEPKWQKFWEENKTFEVTEDKAKQKFYSLIEFPYPSGEGLHVGHPRPFTAMDVVSRKKRMEGYNVLYPIGFDAFGLPTENFAIKTGKPPAEVTKKNIANFTRQLKALGYSFDWSRQVDTTDPNYYKWTQWLFLQFYKHGLAYKKNQPINWCPKDKIGLANEEVVNGCCERCGTPVEKRNKEQWMLAITKYADKLLDGLKEVDYIPQAKIQQENWIGRSEGASVRFSVIPTEEERRAEESLSQRSSDSSTPLRCAQNDNRIIEVFTTRPDTIFGVTFIAVSAELARSWIDNGWKASKEIEKYIDATIAEQKVLDREEKEKTGIDSGLKAINPVNGEEIPVWITNYVMGGVGTGAIMGVPAHDERDKDFAEKYNLKKINVVCPTKEYWQNKIFIYRLDLDKWLYNTNEHTPSAEKDWQIKIDQGYKDFKNDLISSKIYFYFDGSGIAINSDFLDGLTTAEAKEKMIEWLEEKGVGKRKVNYKLRDWVFSRQRYWGEPIPLVYCESCAKNQESGIRNHAISEGERLNPGWIPLPESELPLTLPKVDKYEPTDTGESPLSKITDWVNTKCPRCGGPAKRETDTMPNWAGSSWYFLRYADPHNDKEFASMDKLEYWMGPKQNQGIATSARTSPSRNDNTGGVDWYNGGMEHTVLHLLYSRFWNQFLFDIGLVPTREPYKKRTSHGLILASDGEKMSKSRGNVVNPDEMIERFGADALRTYIMFMGPFDQPVAWDTNGLVGVQRFLEKVWNLHEKVIDDGSSVILSPVTGVKDPLPKTERDSSVAATLPQNDRLLSKLHQTIKKVSDDIEKMSFNTAVAKMMELVNEMSRETKISPIAYRILVQLLSPFAPHMSEELWSILGNKESISKSEWPKYDAELAKESTFTIAVQINGKVRDQIEIDANASEDAVKKLVLESEKVQKWLEGKEPKKIIYVKGKLVSVVV